ncbi:MAG: hypothetical protein IT163_12715 [Bryobacterales bacterium]|nr:hypothetical protein [Bryobacterales bacterium]
MIRAILCALLAAGLSAQETESFRRARENGKSYEQAIASTHRLLQAWLKNADAKTLLLPDRIHGRRGLAANDTKRLYTPHNSGADLYPYLIITARLTAPDLYHGRMMHMLRNEVRYTTAQESIPGNLEMTSGELGPSSLFGAGEYAKDGLLSITEYLGRTPWFYRMVDMVADAMNRAPVETRFGRLPASDAELNGDYMQALARLAPMTGDRRFQEWGRRIADAYMEEVLPGNHGVPSGKWDFRAHTGDGRLKLIDHGNETIAGLLQQFALENYHRTPRAEKWRPGIALMLDRVLASANPHGMLYNEVDAATLKPLNTRLSDNWGYVYGAMYTFYQCTGETKYRDAVRRVLKNLPHYRNHVWESNSTPEMPLGSFDGYADSIESALYLVNREPVPEALDWIDSEMQVMMGMQKPDGHIENWYGEGNYNRTATIYALMKSQGVRPERWEPGVRVGAVREGARLYLSLDMPAARRIQFDYARHKREINLDQNYVRLNEFPEWYAVDENTLYRVGGQLFLGSELIAGISMKPGEWVVEAAGKAPYGTAPR